MASLAPKQSDTELALRQAVASEPDSAEHSSRLSVFLVQSGRMEEASDVLKAFLEKNAESAQAWNNLSGVYELQRRFAEALDAASRAVQITQGNAIYHSQYGRMLAKLGQYQDAVKQFQYALNVDPHNEKAKKSLSLSLLAIGKLDETLRHMKTCAAGSHGVPWNLLKSSQLTDKGFALEEYIPVRQQKPVISRYKLQHDRDQLRYLLFRERIKPHFAEVVDAYEQVLADLPESMPLYESCVLNDIPLQRPHWKLFQQCYNRPMFVPELPVLDGAVINPALDVKAIEEAYFDSSPRMVWVDNLLTEKALEQVHRFCLEATVWNDVRWNYLGAYLLEGFASTLILRISEELRLKFPRIFKEHRLMQLWGYKYGAEGQGIRTHADEASVNINFWVTPDEANLDPECGGLEVFTAEAPYEWDFHRFNRDVAAMEAFLDQHGRKSIHVPHRCNRALIFDSNLFHRTDTMRFRDDFESRRINITMLYGERAAK